MDASSELNNLQFLLKAIETDTNEFLKSDDNRRRIYYSIFNTSQVYLVVDALKTEAISALVKAKLKEADVAARRELAFDDVATGDVLLANQQKTNVKRLVRYIADYFSQKGVTGLPEKDVPSKEKEKFAKPLHQIGENLDYYFKQIVVYLMTKDKAAEAELTIGKMENVKFRRILPDSYFCRLPDDLVMKLKREAVMLYELNRDAVKDRVTELKTEARLYPNVIDHEKDIPEAFLGLSSFLFKKAYGISFSEFILYNHFNDYCHPELEQELKYRRDKKVKEYKKMANDVGTKIAPPVKRYALFTFCDMYKGKEFQEDKDAFASRFRLLKIGAGKKTGLSTSILERMKKLELEAKNVIVQLPKSMADQEVLMKIKEKAPGIKFMIIDTQGLRNTASKEARGKYRRNIYSMMVLARNINLKTRKNSKLYRLLRFFVEEHFPIMENRDTEIDKYMQGLMNNRISQIINFILSYKPAEKISEPDVDIVSAALMFA